MSYYVGPKEPTEIYSPETQDAFDISQISPVKQIERDTSYDSFVEDFFR